jgi:hypothetical protein
VRPIAAGFSPETSVTEVLPFSSRPRQQELGAPGFRRGLRESGQSLRKLPPPPAQPPSKRAKLQFRNSSSSLERVACWPKTTKTKSHTKRQPEPAPLKAIERLLSAENYAEGIARVEALMRRFPEHGGLRTMLIEALERSRGSPCRRAAHLRVGRATAEQPACPRGAAPVRDRVQSSHACRAHRALRAAFTASAPKRNPNKDAKGLLLCKGTPFIPVSGGFSQSHSAQAGRLPAFTLRALGKAGKDRQLQSGMSPWGPAGLGVGRRRTIEAYALR